MVVYTRIHLVIVSIHTPTQGVTYLSFPSFQNGVFQSTHPRRVWRCYSILQCVRQSFNPHTHAGCDMMWCGRMIYRAEFQSTHPRRVWQGDLNEKFAERVVSIHTPTQGVTTYGYIAVIVRMFQSTHPRRVWQIIFRIIRIAQLFQSTHPRRVWLINKIKIKPYGCFNPHTHAGCD